MTESPSLRASSSCLALSIGCRLFDIARLFASRKAFNASILPIDSTLVVGHHLIGVARLGEVVLPRMAMASSIRGQRKPQ